MASPAVVEVVERCRIAPPPGSVPTTTLPLTYLDLPWFMVPPVERIFFYEFHHSKDYFFDTLLPNLKHSLSVTLRHFFPLAGNLTWPQDSSKPEIIYKEGDTIPLTVAESTYDFQSLSGNHARPAEEFYHLVPSFAARSPTDALIPLMCLQVTLFPGSGLCIGISVNHVCADGRTSNHFLKSWASVCRSKGDDANVLSALPVYDRPTLPYHQEREQVLIKENERIVNVTKETLFNTPASPPPPVDKVRATLVMRRSDITMLRHWVMPRLMTKELRLSSFALTCANVWVSWIKSQLDRDTINYRELFIFPVDCRDQLTPPLPTTYFGNCFGFGIAESTTHELVRENGVAIAAEVIVKGIQETRSDMWGSCERLYAEVPTGVRATTESMRIMTVAGSPKLSVYETDFGWGKPKKVEVISIGERGSISLSESPTEEGALEIGLVGSKQGIDAFTTIYVNNLSSLSSSISRAGPEVQVAQAQP